MSINNEIKRIKSLFTDERMYGNLINESCSCSDADMVDELSDTHYVTKKDPNQVANKNCINNIENTWLKCVKDSYDSASITDYEIFDYNNGGCSIIYEFNSKNVEDMVWGVSLTPVQGVVQFWEKGNFDGNEKTFVAKWYSRGAKLDKNVMVDFRSEGGNKNIWVTTGDIKGYTIRGSVDGNCKITSAFITNVYQTSGGEKKIRKIKVDAFNGVSLEDGIIKKWGK